MRRKICVLLAVLLFCGAAQAQEVSVRVKDIVTYKGTADTQLTGEGLVVGLKGTGDDKDAKTLLMLQAMSSKLNQSKLPASAYATKNVARVIVSVEVPAFKGYAGQTLTCRVSVADKSKSLEHGTLFPTLLFFSLDAGDKTEYATASGRITLAQDGDKPRNPVNGSVTGSMLQDIKVEFFTTRVDDYGKRHESVTLLLSHPDSATANEIASRINEARALNAEVSRGHGAPASLARALNDGVVEVTIPPAFHGDEMRFKELVDSLSVNPDLVAVVTIDETTGVIVFSGNVRVLPGAFTVRGISVTIGAGGDVPERPEPGTSVKSATVPLSRPNVQLRQLIDTFNLLKLDAGEKVAVIRALSQNGMLQAKVRYE